VLNSSHNPPYARCPKLWGLETSLQCAIFVSFSLLGLPSLAVAIGLSPLALALALTLIHTLWLHTQS